jgi:uncharacterized protein involved in outer membrane biogenesis
MQAKPKRRNPLRPLLLTAGAVVVLGAAAYVVMASALDPNRLREDLRDAVRRQTGRELTAGAVHLRFGLSPQIEVQDVGLANIDGGSRSLMLTARSVRARLALLPLLGGDAVISGLTIVQPDLLLEQGAGGVPNWRFSPQHRALYSNHQGSGGGGSHHVEIQSVTMQGGQVSWRPAQGDPVTLGIGLLTLSSEGNDQPMSLSFNGTHAGAPVTVEASAGSLQRLQGGPVSALAGAWPLTVDATAQGATVHLSGGINHPDQGRGYQFRMTASAPMLDTLNGLVSGITLPPLHDVNATGVLSDGSAGELRTSQVSIHAGPSDLSSWAAGLVVKQAVLSAPGPGQLVQLNVDGTYQDQPLRVSASTTQPDVVGASAPLQVTIEAQAAGATATARGTMPPRLNASGLDMIVSVRASDLSALSPLAGRQLPAAKNLTIDAKVGDAGVKLRGIAVRDLAIASSLGDVSGQLTVDWAPRPTIDGTLTSRTLDFDGLAPGVLASGLPVVWPAPSSAGQVSPPQAPTPGPTLAGPPTASATASTDTLPLARLRTTDADLDLTVGDLAIAGKRYSDVQAHLQLANGKLALNPLRAVAPEGAIIGGLSIDASSDMPPVAVTLRSPSISAEAVAGAFGYPGAATGTMQVDAQLSGVGQTVQALETSLDGHLGLAMVNGTVEDTLVEALIGAALDTAGVQSFGGGSSQVRCFAMRIDFQHGRGIFRALAADTSRLTLDGSGELDLAAQTADLHLRPRVRLGPTEIAAPVSLRGPFNQMRASLDPVLGGGRFGLTIGSAPAGPSSCISKLAVARGGLGGPVPVVQADSANSATPLVIRKPRDLLKGLFH